MIIVEGVDGSGKTNLVNRLSKEFGIHPEKRVVDKDTNPMIPSLKQWVEVDLRTWPRAAIYDRHRMISEPIYAPIMRGRLADGFEDSIWFIRQYGMFWKYHPVVIYCIPPFDVVINNVMAEETENETISPFIASLYWLYHTDYCRNAGRSNVILWDYTQDSYDDHLHYIKHLLKEEFNRDAEIINRYFPDARETIITPTQDETGRKRSSRFRR